MARPVFIVDGSRTPFLKARSGPGPFTPVDLAVQCGRPLLARQPFSPADFDQVILGCVNVIADEMNPARVAALRLGMGEDMVAFTVQINCGSGMQSIDTAYRYIREGHADMILAGGTEALSHAPLVWPNSGVRWFAGLATAKGMAAKLAAAFKLVAATDAIAKRMRGAHIRDWKEAVTKGVITQAEGEQLAAAHEAVTKVIEVDDFAPEVLSPIYKKTADVHQFFQELGEQRAAS